MPPTRKSATAEKSAIDERFDEQNIKFEKLFEQNNKLIELLTRVIEENSVLRGKVENLEKIVIDQQNVIYGIYIYTEYIRIYFDVLHRC